MALCGLCERPLEEWQSSMTCPCRAPNERDLPRGTYLRFRWGRRIWVVDRVMWRKKAGEPATVLVRTFARRSGTFQYKLLDPAEQERIRIVPASEVDHG